LPTGVLVLDFKATVKTRIAFAAVRRPLDTRRASDIIEA
jgi:hypothetical protein